MASAAVFGLSCGLGCAQSAPDARTDSGPQAAQARNPVVPDLFKKIPGDWTQAEREWGFRNWDLLGPTRPVRAGGAALKDGHIKSLDDPIVQYIWGLAGSAYDGVTVRQLLTMTTGARWNEDYSDSGADAYKLFRAQPADGLDVTTSYMRQVKRRFQPGTTWHYNSGETTLLGILVREATRKPLADYASEKIWAAYGMEQDARWNIDATGAEMGGCCFQATTRDFARFGQ